MNRSPITFMPSPYIHADFNNPDKEAFENNVGKGESIGNQHLVLFSQCFLPSLGQILSFGPLLMISSWTSLKFYPRPTLQAPAPFPEIVSEFKLGNDFQTNFSCNLELLPM